MANPLFDPILPKESSESGQLIEYRGKVGDFDRLTEIVETDIAAVSNDQRPQNWRAAPVDIRLEFGWAGGLHGVPAITGRATTELPAVCQRCLETFDLSLDASVKMLLVRPGETPTLSEYEVWELEDETVRALDIVEEALVMAVPLAPSHDSAESCTALAIEHTDFGPETVRPFAGLGAQMEKTNK